MPIYTMYETRSLRSSRYHLPFTCGRETTANMDGEQEEMKFLRFFGMVKESFRIIFTWWKIFGQITLVLILPLSFLTLSSIQVSTFPYYWIQHDQQVLNQVPTNNSSADNHLSELETMRIVYWLLMIAYLVLALLSTLAVIYTIACIYMGKAVTFKNVICMFPKVWKRLLVTFAWSFLLALIYNTIPFVLLYVMINNLDSFIVLLSGSIVLLLLYLTGLVYMRVIWLLAGAVSVLEEDYGIRALVKSKMLMRGKMGPGAVTILLLDLSYAAIQLVFNIFVVDKSSLAPGFRLMIGALCLSCLLTLFLFELVVVTVLYFVCKSYHNESIDKSSLPDHLEIYLLPEHIPPISKDVQQEHV